jgi:hypothetical protein
LVFVLVIAGRVVQAADHPLVEEVVDSQVVLDQVALGLDQPPVEVAVQLRVALEQVVLATEQLPVEEVAPLLLPMPLEQFEEMEILARTS